MPKEEKGQNEKKNRSISVQSQMLMKLHMCSVRRRKIYSASFFENNAYQRQTFSVVEFLLPIPPGSDSSSGRAGRSNIALIRGS